MIIGISGKLGSGKNTVASVISQLDSSFIEKAFAYKLKQIVAVLASCPIEDTMTQEGKNTFVEGFNLTIGEMLQKVGTNALRDHFNENVWINALLIELRKAEGNYIITDCRFKNEAKAIKDAGGILIRVERPVNPIAEKSNRDLTHASEVDLDDYDGFDHVIINDGDLQSLQDKIVDTFYMKIVKPHKVSL